MADFEPLNKTLLEPNREEIRLEVDTGLAVIQQWLDTNTSPHRAVLFIAIAEEDDQVTVIVRGTSEDLLRGMMTVAKALNNDPLSR